MLSKAWAILASFSVVVPAIFYAAFRYAGNPKDFVEILSIYGYSLTVYIPISLLMIPPSPAWQWIMVIVAGCSSTEFLVSNLWKRSPPGWATVSSVKGCACLLGILIEHTALAFVIKLSFFTV